MCMLEIGHAGHHSTAGHAWPRPSSATTMDDDVRDLLDDALEGVHMEMQWPIQVEVTYRKVIMMEGDSLEHALKRASRMDWGDLDTSPADAFDWDLEISRPDMKGPAREVNQAMYEEEFPKFGPVVRCSECGECARTYNPSRVYHRDPLLRCYGTWSYWPSGRRV